MIRTRAEESGWAGASPIAREVDPDPLKGLVHGATVTQVCRFYYLLATGKLISAERSRQMLHILSFPDIHDKFVSVMERSIPLAHLYRKSGTWHVWYCRFGPRVG